MYSSIDAKFWRESRNKLGVALVLSNFTNNLGSNSLGAFLLWNSMVGAYQTCRSAVLARAGGFADALDLAAVTALYDCERAFWVE
jgi:hypothetical protein